MINPNDGEVKILFFILCGKKHPRDFLHLTDHRQEWIGEFMRENEVRTQMDHLGGLNVWLDLKINNVIIGPILVFVGLILCNFNFNAHEHKQRKTICFLIACIFISSLALILWDNYFEDQTFYIWLWWGIVGVSVFCAFLLSYLSIKDVRVFSL